jgi:hypothetical protein
MDRNNSILPFIKDFVKPNVYIFILGGAGIILLTFFTENNALEIVISGVASIFIGIGVNNLTMMETHRADEVKLKMKIGYAVKVLEIFKAMTIKISAGCKPDSGAEIQNELEGLVQFLELSITLIRETGDQN